MQEVKQKASLGEREYECDLSVPDVEKVGYWIAEIGKALSSVLSSALENKSLRAKEACYCAFTQVRIPGGHTYELAEQAMELDRALSREKPKPPDAFPSVRVLPRLSDRG